MKLLTTTLACMTLSWTAFAAPAKMDFKTDDQKSLYLLGAVFGQKIMDLSLSSSELEYVKVGLQDVAQGKEPRVDPAAYNTKLEALVRSRREKRAEAEKIKSQAVIDKAATEKGAVKTDTGIVYIVSEPGTGVQATMDQGVKINYRSILPNGKVLEDTFKRGTAAEFPEPVSRLIPCWQETLTKLKVGGKLRAYCPSSTAYGDGGNPIAGVAGGSAIVFDFEMLEVLKPQPAPKQPK